MAGADVGVVVFAGTGVAGATGEEVEEVGVLEGATGAGVAGVTTALVAAGTGASNCCWMAEPWFAADFP